jgi:hypothetical protein
VTIGGKGSHQRDYVAGHENRTKTGNFVIAPNSALARDVTNYWNRSRDPD